MSRSTHLTSSEGIAQDFQAPSPPLLKESRDGGCRKFSSYLVPSQVRGLSVSRTVGVSNKCDEISVGLL